MPVRGGKGGGAGPTGRGPSACGEMELTMSDQRMGGRSSGLTAEQLYAYLALLRGGSFPRTSFTPSSSSRTSSPLGYGLSLIWRGTRAGNRGEYPPGPPEDARRPCGIPTALQGGEAESVHGRGAGETRQDDGGVRPKRMALRGRLSGIGSPPPGKRGTAE